MGQKATKRTQPLINACYCILLLIKCKIVLGFLILEIEFERIFVATFFELPRMEVGIQTVMKFGYECTSLQMAVYCETFKGTKNVQCYNLVIKWLDICFCLPVKSNFRQPTYVTLLFYQIEP
mgnify:CR=1 FL=1